MEESRPGKGNSVCKCLEALESWDVTLGAMRSPWRVASRYWSGILARSR